MSGHVAGMAPETPIHFTMVNSLNTQTVAATGHFIENIH